MTTEASPPAKRFPVGLTIATVIALAILVGLGVWQVKRLAWKEALLARIAALQAAPATPAGPVLARLATGENTDFTRVELDCPGLSSAPFVEVYAIPEGGDAGWRIISACPLPSGPYGSVLVDRGFVSGEATGAPPVDAGSKAPFHMVGVLRKPDPPTFVTPKPDLAARRWWSRDVPAIASVLGAPRPAPQMLMAEVSTNPDFKPLVPAAIPTNIPNRHFEYALTWFGLAATLACVYAASLWKWWKG